MQAARSQALCTGQVVRPSAILDLIRSAETLRLEQSAADRVPEPRLCERCGYISSQVRIAITAERFNAKYSMLPALLLVCGISVAGGVVPAANLDCQLLTAIEYYQHANSFAIMGLLRTPAAFNELVTMTSRILFQSTPAPQDGVAGSGLHNIFGFRYGTACRLLP